jgi:hypothetical protein
MNDLPVVRGRVTPGFYAGPRTLAATRKRILALYRERIIPALAAVSASA